MTARPSPSTTYATIKATGHHGDVEKAARYLARGRFAAVEALAAEIAAREPFNPLA